VKQNKGKKPLISSKDRTEVQPELALCKQWSIGGDKDLSQTPTPHLVSEKRESETWVSKPYHPPEAQFYCPVGSKY